MGGGGKHQFNFRKRLKCINISLNYSTALNPCSKGAYIYMFVRWCVCVGNEMDLISAGTREDLGIVHRPLELWRQEKLCVCTLADWIFSLA